MLVGEARPAPGPSIPKALFLFACLVAVQWFAQTGLTTAAVNMLPASWTASGWPYGYVGHTLQLLVALALIAVLRPLPRFDPGFRWPKGYAYIGIALGVGVVGGVLMLLVDNGPDILGHRPPAGPYTPTIGNIVPWLMMQGVFVGITEEIPFRALFLGYLLLTMPQRISVGRTDISWATIATSIIFALAHIESFWQEPLGAAIGQQLYVTAFGIFYGWLFERSRSIVVPIIAHNAGDFVEWSLLFLMSWAWG